MEATSITKIVSYLPILLEGCVIKIQDSDYDCGYCDRIVILSTTATNRTITLFDTPVNKQRITIVHRASGTAELTLTGGNIIGADNITVQSIEVTGTVEMVFIDNNWEIIK